MTPVEFMACAFAMAIGAGLVGALLGLGGGIIVVPAISLVLGVDIRYAIGASIVSVIATSSAAGAAYLKRGVANIRLAMFLELGTSAGALGGAILAGIVERRLLYFIFAAALTGAAALMWRHQRRGGRPAARSDRIAETLDLDGSYLDHTRCGVVEYRVSRTPFGLALGGCAGVASGLLGIGGGVITVPTMALGMGVPMKVATTTSNFMIGVTAAASAGVYFARGDIDPYIAAPTALGVLVGSFLGARYLHRIHSSRLRAAFTLILVIVASQMALKGLRL